MNDKGIVVLSLFDGISAGRLALERAGISVKKYYASEIDKYAISITQHNYPDTIQLGDVEKVDFTQFEGEIDLLIGGSPCTNLSIAGNRKGLEGDESRLFWEYVRAIKECKPKYFFLENVESMTDSDKEIISKELGCYPIMINSALLSGQNRKRYYWFNWGKRQVNLFGFPTCDIPQPEDKGILLKDILESGMVDIDKSFCITQRYEGQFGSPEYTLKRYCKFKMGCIVAEPIGLGKLNGDTIEPLDKARTVTAYYSTGQTLEHTLEKNIHSMVLEPVKILEDNVKDYAEIDKRYVEKHLKSLSDKLGYVPTIFNAWNEKEIKEKSPTVTCYSGSQTSSGSVNIFTPIRLSEYEKSKGQVQRVYSVKGKSVVINGNGGGQGGKTGLYKIDLPDGDYIIRKLTPIECERLQTMPDNYTEYGTDGKISNTQRYKCIGNSWTVDVISYILSFLKTELDK